jgi:uncharacterized peroxidase-related enzyme
MRLEILHNGHHWRNHLALRVMRLAAGSEPDDVIKTSLYRPEFFGQAWIDLLHSVMRGPSDWTPGERELFAVFTSRLNTCHFCVGIHIRTTGIALDPAITIERLDNWRNAGFEPRIVATLDLLEKMTLTPASIASDDIVNLRARGISNNAIMDAMHVCFLFNLVNRLANALDYNYGTEAEALKAATILNRVQYNLPKFLLH